MVRDNDGHFVVIVIGAGYGGAAVGALCADQGKRVALIDKTPRAGGKSQPLDRQGYRYEMFGAVGIPALDSRFHELVDALGIGDRVELLVPEGEKAAVHYRPADGDWRSMRSALWSAPTNSQRSTGSASPASSPAGLSPVSATCSTRVFDAALVPIFSDQSWLDSDRFAAMEAGHWPDIPLIAIDVASEFDSGLVAEPGHQVANIQVFVSPGPESPMGAEAVDRAREVVDELYPDLRTHTIRTEPYGALQISRMTRDATVPGTGGEAVGLAPVVERAGTGKPSARTPPPGLYLVGCDAGGRGSDTHQAVDSGFNVAAMVLSDLAG